VIGMTLLSSIFERHFTAASTALATSELNYQSLFMHNPDAVFSLDAAGTFQHGNPATLARDAGLIVHQAAYRCTHAGVVNMFPHTAHVESMAVFERVD